MADFLLRLAERTLGAASVIQPLLTPRFAPQPTPAKDFLSDTGEVSSHPAREDHVTPFPSATVFSRPVVTREDPFSNAARQSVRPPATAQSDPQIYEAPDTLNNEEATVARMRTEGGAPILAKPQPRAATSLPPRSEVTSARPRTTADEGASLLLPSLVARASQLPSHQPSSEASRGGISSVAVNLVPSHEYGRLGQPEHWQEKQEPTHRTASSSPVIRVTIARIDVRAVTPPGPAVPHVASTRSVPTLSLEEYLGQRERRKR